MDWLVIVYGVNFDMAQDLSLTEQIMETLQQAEEICESDPSIVWDGYDQFQYSKI